MELYKLLNFLHGDIPIILFDIAGNQLLSVLTKTSVPTTFYEYDIYEIALGTMSTGYKSSALYITLVK